MFGPHLYFDLVRHARRGRTTLIRVGYVGLLLLTLYLAAPSRPTRRINDYAEAAERYAVPLIALQYVIVLVLTPFYFGSAVIEEHESGTIELLFMSPLTEWQIVLGKLGSRWVQVAGVLAAGLPVLAIVHLWGGVEMAQLLYHLATCLLLLLALGSACLWTSVENPTAAQGVANSVGLTILLCFPLSCVYSCVSPYGGMLGWGPWARWGVPVALFALCLIVALFCCSQAALRLRFIRQGRLSSRPAPPAAPVRLRRNAPPPLSEIWANALLWKECRLDAPLGRGRQNLLRSEAARRGLIMIAAVALTALATHWFNRFALGVSNERLDAACFVAAVYGYALPLAGCAADLWLLSTRCVARERERGTLDALLLLPVERGDILSAKAWGCLYQAGPLLLVSAGSVLFGLACGQISPEVAQDLLALPLPVLAVVGAAGFYFSVRCRTVLQANLAMGVALLLALTGQVVHLNYSRPYYDVLARRGYAVPSLRVLHDEPLDRLLTFDLNACLVTAPVLLALAYRRFARTRDV